MDGDNRLAGVGSSHDLDLAGLDDEEWHLLTSLFDEHLSRLHGADSSARRDSGDLR
jgi:hypothetical protein